MPGEEEEGEEEDGEADDAGGGGSARGAPSAAGSYGSPRWRSSAALGMCQMSRT
jgi:hypothetical protein